MNLTTAVVAGLSRRRPSMLRNDVYPAALCTEVSALGRSRTREALHHARSLAMSRCFEGACSRASFSWSLMAGWISRRSMFAPEEHARLAEAAPGEEAASAVLLIPARRVYLS